MNSGINPKEKDYELARENTVAMNCHFLVCGIISIAYFVEFLKGDGTPVVCTGNHYFSNGTGSRRNYLL